MGGRKASERAAIWSWGRWLFLRNMFLRLSSRRNRLRVEACPCNRSIMGEDRRLHCTEKLFIMSSMSSVVAPRVDMSGMPEKFSGQHFKRWQHRMKIWFTIIGFISVLELDCPILVENDPNNQKAVDE
ncbi:hypothetical protein Taro_038696 [Colocasia esculenta]|uniref:Uncharacterized protein n=1 Tax=Colocasia esculenta TaxID=4460 RepID=A0A843W8S8_COLES|nr:hypothetical protein [Colocasia esculenta]